MTAGCVRRMARAGVVVVLAAAAACGDRAATSRDDAPAVPGGIAAADGSARPGAARDIVAEAVRTASAEGKTVLIEFGASWCTWCTNFQNFVQSADAGRVIRDNFVVVNLVVREEDDKKALEHPGGAELMAEWGGAESGLPFYVFLDATGSKVADSNAMPEGGNIGYPVTELEIRQFMSLLDKAAPRMSANDRLTVLSYLQKGGAGS